MSSSVVYVTAKAGGRQEEVFVGSVIIVNRPDEEVGDIVELESVLLVDGEKITLTADGVSAKMTAEIMREEKGPKILIVKYKNKTGYRKCQGHRQKLTRLKAVGTK